ncbi:hypothetical protein NQ315_011369 [Exocentrus adspersus]|uniref:Transposable element P transposase n=1 Tax=Exocentrus adspersus TaxID=1586481 RepID=A0AAV8V832_9CUCU|nr:hypothetical protein NQ315_011369 [Exocentrus adspersus]
MCQNIGLKIVAMVCDQGSGNQSALNSLISEGHIHQEENRLSFDVNGKEIILIYDVPHLFKGVRNNLLNKELHFKINGDKKVAKWDDIIDFYYLDTADSTRLCPKLTDLHVLPDKINKMKVSCCTQVFSNQVGSLMKRISQWDIQDEYKLKKSASDTADLILFLDQLFDSLNSNSKIAPSSKPLKGGISKNSGHKQFWYDSLKIIRSMRYFSKDKKQYVSTPSLKNLSKTARGFIYLSEKLLAHGFKFILPREINQDPLENFFAAIRSHGIRNTSPNVTQFTSSYKALLVNNFLSSHSPSSNCEEDFSDSALDSLHCFLTGDSIPGVRPLEDDDGEDYSIPSHVSIQKRTRVGNATLNYIAGYVAKKALKDTNNCESCKKLLLHRKDFPEKNLEFIEARQYKGIKLLKPGHLIFFVATNVAKII